MTKSLVAAIQLFYMMIVSSYLSYFGTLTLNIHCRVSSPPLFSSVITLSVELCFCDVFDCVELEYSLLSLLSFCDLIRVLCPVLMSKD